MTFLSSKTWGHDVGLSACFRQWRSTHSHCQYLHGYALSVAIQFSAPTLDDRNWVVDFGGLAEVKTWLRDTFDHKTVVAIDDPQLEWFREAEKRGIVDLVVLPAVGCEKFAELVYEKASSWLVDAGLSPRCRVAKVEIKEHGANSAIYQPNNDEVSRQ